eukprot:scaffold122062_cov18-Tisochrysis_lutea.AAC.2
MKNYIDAAYTHKRSIKEMSALDHETRGTQKMLLEKTCTATGYIRERGQARDICTAAAQEKW